MDFTKKELEMILDCINSTLDWTPSNLSPDFYDTINGIECKCLSILDAMEKDPSEMIYPTDKKTYHAPEVTTSLKSLLSGIQLN